MLGVLFVVVGMGLAGCGGCVYFMHEVTDDPLPFSGPMWLVFLTPLLARIALYLLSGLFKGLAEERREALPTLALPHPRSWREIYKPIVLRTR